MGFRSTIMRLLHREQPATQRFEALRSDAEALQSVQNTQQLEQPESLEIQKDSLQLGLAAGYTGHSIRNIETALNRMELQMATKDWVTANFQGTLDVLVNMEKTNQEHMKNMRERLEYIENLMKTLEDNLIFHRARNKDQMTAKMRDALHIIELSGEISYDDLAARLNVTVSSLRGLLSVIARRTDKVKRFEKDNKGWVSFVMNSDSKRFESESPVESDVMESENKATDAQNTENKP